MNKMKKLTTNTFPAFCREHGLKCTPQRLAVFAALRGAMGHPSVDEIWATVKKTVPTVTRDSVYRILNDFAAIGLIGRLDALSAARYDTRMEPHAHFICEICGSVTDYSLPAALPIPGGMPHEQHHLELRVTGICDNCPKGVGARRAEQVAVPQLRRDRREREGPRKVSGVRSSEGPLPA